MESVQNWEYSSKHHSDGESCFKYPPSTPAGWQLPKQDDIWGEMGALLPFHPISGVPLSPGLVLQGDPQRGSSIPSCLYVRHQAAGRDCFGKSISLFSLLMNCFELSWHKALSNPKSCETSRYFLYLHAPQGASTYSVGSLHLFSYPAPTRPSRARPFSRQVLVLILRLASYLVFFISNCLNFRLDVPAARRCCGRGNGDWEERAPE